MKLIGLITRTVGAIAVLKFTGCVEHTTINARNVNMTKPVSVTARADVRGLPLSMP